MHYELNKVYHIYNRGNNKGRIFFNESNYILFRDKIAKLLQPQCEILTWCLMPNHFHLLVLATENSVLERESFGGKPMQSLPYKTGVLLSSYSQLMNKQNKTTGSLFQQKTKSKPIEDLTYFIRCIHYIHHNPLKAGLIRGDLSAWRYSSFAEYSRQTDFRLSHPTRLFELTGYDQTSFLRDSRAYLSSEREAS